MSIVTKDELVSNLEKIQHSIFNNNFMELKDSYSTVDFEKYNEDANIRYFYNIKAIKIDRWVYDKKEEIIDKFNNIYSTFSREKDSLALLIKRKVTGVELYFVVKNDKVSGGSEFRTKNTIALLEKSIKGNFNGTLTQIGRASCRERVFRAV